MVSLRTPTALVVALGLVLAGWYARGALDPNEVIRRVSATAGSTTPIEIRDVIHRDTVTQLVWRDRLRVQRVPARVHETRLDTLIATNPFQARLDTAMGGDSVTVVFDYPPPVWSLVDVRRAPDTVRSILERREVDRIVFERPRFLERVGGGAVRGWATSSVVYAVDRSRGATGGLSYAEAAGIGVLSGVVVDTLMSLGGW